MKVWAIILSIYVTLLATMPCCAFDNCPDDKAATEQTSQHNQGDEDGCGSCSPFFNCNTCNASFITVSVSFNFAPVVFVKSLSPQYRSVIPARIAGKIWQPPKLG